MGWRMARSGVGGGAGQGAGQREYVDAGEFYS